ncbi:hypothetical protein [Granulicella sp. dw_53]|uniref:hypothetical protein n=1 Tax=Granulicella sp. dw_53 TaxID=2719792 RepID=UPI0021065FD6|nr:hypothetical protein [Granulicella sp. dw_53]
MMEDSAPRLFEKRTPKRGALLTIAVGGLLGPKAEHGGVGTYLLGVSLHFFIALSASAIYYTASRSLGFLKEHPLLCGLFYGAAVETVMNLVVLPLSALHARGPYELHDLIQGLLVHMVVVGLPISFSVRRFATQINQKIDVRPLQQRTTISSKIKPSKIPAKSHVNPRNALT